MTPDHHARDDKFPGIIRWTTDTGRTFVAYGDPEKHAETVKQMIEERVK